MSEIKEFLSKFDNALEAVEKEPEQAGKLVCEAVNLKMRIYEEIPMFTLSDAENAVYEFCDEMAKSLDMVNEIEKAVIEKVGTASYIESLSIVCGYEGWYCYEPKSIRIAVCEIATADAKTRLAALLMALAEVEGCD